MEGDQTDLAASPLAVGDPTGGPREDRCRISARQLFHRMVVSLRPMAEVKAMGSCGFLFPTEMRSASLVLRMARCAERRAFSIRGEHAAL
jgi:hypothetical protein